MKKPVTLGPDLDVIFNCGLLCKLDAAVTWLCIIHWVHQKNYLFYDLSVLISSLKR